MNANAAADGDSYYAYPSDDDVAFADAADDGVTYSNSGGNDDDNYVDPYTDFDITQCDTYENLWMWDLSMTCDDSDTFDNCECVYTEQLMANGYLTCYDIALCPQDCTICEKCLQIVGCATNVGGTPGVTISSDTFPYYIIGVAAGVIIAATVTYTKIRQHRNSDSLGAHLMEDDPRASTPPPASRGNEPEPWLAPTEFPDALPPGPPQFSPEKPSMMPIPIPLPIIGDSSSDESEETEKTDETEEGQVWLAPLSADN